MAERKSGVGSDVFADFIADLREQGIEIPDPIEPERPPGYDWNKFAVAAVVYSRPRKRGAELDRQLRTLPNRNKVLYGQTGFDDDEFPAFIHTTSELAAWLGGGEGVEYIAHDDLERMAGVLLKRVADNARRRKRIDVAG